MKPQNLSTKKMWAGEGCPFPCNPSQKQNLAVYTERIDTLSITESYTPKAPLGAIPPSPPLSLAVCLASLSAHTCTFSRHYAHVQSEHPCKVCRGNATTSSNPIFSAIQSSPFCSPAALSDRVLVIGWERTKVKPTNRTFEVGLSSLDSYKLDWPRSTES